MTFAFPLPSPFWFPVQIFLKFAPAAHFFWNFISPFKNKGWNWEGVENYVHSSENLCNIISLFLYVFLNVLLLTAMFDMVFHKNSEHFYDQIKKKTGKIHF